LKGLLGLLENRGCTQPAFAIFNDYLIVFYWILEHTVKQTHASAGRFASSPNIAL
jgi:hypothetical protein